MDKSEARDSQPEAEVASCDPTLTRKLFMQKVIKGGALAGGLLIGPKVLDKFLIPPAYATTSSCNVTDTSAAGCTNTNSQDCSSSDVNFGGGVVNSCTLGPQGQLETLCVTPEGAFPISPACIQ